MEEIDLHPETVAFMVIEIEEILAHMAVDDPVFEDLANLLNLLVNIGKGTIHVNLI
jgi:hypothetical protein